MRSKQVVKENHSVQNRVILQKREPNKLTFNLIAKTMKKIIILFSAIFLLSLTVDAFAAPKRFHVAHIFEGKGRPRAKSELVICIADKEAGYVELQFRANLGTVQISIADSNGNVVDEATLDTTIENFASLNLPDPDDNYTIEIEGAEYSGRGTIE